MSELTKDKFLYMYTGELEADQVVRLVRKGLDKYLSTLPKEEREARKKYDFIVNVVEDKNYNKKKFSYGWISDLGLFHVLLGNNEDGSSRVEWIDDPDWVEPDGDVNLELGSGMDWGETIWSECPKIKKVLPPLITIDSYLDKDNEEHTLDFFKAKLKYKSHTKNEIFSRDIPDCISINFLMNVFKKFSMDKTKHFIKKKKEYVEYPIIKFSEWNGKRNCTVEFSPIDQDLAPFVLSITKKLCYGHTKREIIHFSQSKKERER